MAHLHRSRFEHHGVIVRSSNYTLYGDMSGRVMRTLSAFTPSLEIFSIDEAFLGLSGFDSRLETHARDLRQTVLQWTGIPVSIGIASTKTLAKVANRFAKTDAGRNGVYVLDTEQEIKAALDRMKLTDLWGINKRLEKRLAAIGITTPRQLRDADPRFVRERLSVVLQRMILELRRIPCMRFEDVAPDRKSIMASRSFGRPVTTYQEMREAVSTYVARAAEKMRRGRLTTDHLMVFINTNRFKVEDAQYYATRNVRLPVATADTGKLSKAAGLTLAAIWRPGFSYKKAGVVLLDLTPAPARQGDLWDRPIRLDQWA
jgi:DNA polymerase V